MNFNIIVAMDSQNGIGKNGQLPWRLAGDMKHFKETTTATEDKAKQNAVIMGRKTWESIPEEFRPLSGRLNVVLTRNKDYSLPQKVLKFESFNRAVSALCRNSEIESIFVIGGGEVYKAASLFPGPNLKIYLTQVEGDFACDTRFPSEILKNLKETDKSEPQIDDGTTYYFCEYARL